MSRRRKRRGVSVGTIVMLVITVCVVGGAMIVLPRLNGARDVTIDTGKVLEALSINGTLPQLSLSDIPIADSPAATDAAGGAKTAADTAAPQADAQTPAPASQAAAATPVPAGGSFSLTLCGSLNIETSVRKSAYVSEAKTFDFSDMLSLLAPEMQSDLCLLPLENLVDPTAKLSDTVTTEQVVAMIASAGVDAADLGFRQAYDQGLPALASTINALSGKGITVLGAFADQDSAQTVRLMTLGGVKVALLGYTDGLSAAGARRMKKDGNAFALPQADAAAIVGDMDRARQAGAQVIVVCLSWGSENKTTPSAAQTALAQQLADGGADVIVGTGTKAVQPAAWLTGKTAAGAQKRTFCVYSLGSLLSDSRKAVNVASLLLQLHLSVDGAGQVTFDQAAFTPTYAWKYKQDGRVRYRVIPSSQAAPDGMTDDQVKSMAAALKLVQDAMSGGALEQR